MFDLNDAVKSVFLKAARLAEAKPLRGDLSAVFTCVNTGKLSSFTHREICALQTGLFANIVARSDANGKTKRNLNNAITSLDLTGSEAHIDALTKIARSVNFSEQFHDWVADRQTILARRLARQKNYAELNTSWKDMDEGHRHGLLKYLMQSQHQIFSNDTISFSPCKMDVVQSEIPMLAYFTFEDAQNGMAGNTKPLMVLKRSFLLQADAGESIKSVVHEGIHSITRQLGMLAYYDRIPKSHPLYNDAQMMLDRMETLAYMPAYLGSPYMADLEERLAHGVHGKFMQLYLEQSNMRELNRVSITPRPQ